MIGMYVSYEVIAFPATFNFSPQKKKERKKEKEKKKKKLFHDLLGILQSMYAGATLRTSSSTGGCGLAGRKLRMQPEEATVKCRLLEWDKHTMADVECH